jgi:hypothetical protein
MDRLLDRPLLLFVVAFAAMWLASIAGLGLRSLAARPSGERGEDFNIVVGSTLSLLALLIGFSVSMAASRYDQRRNLEATEANAIGTEFKRATLLPPQDAARVRTLLSAYLDQRIQFFESQDDAEQARINARTDQLDAALWEAVRAPTVAQPTAVTALVAAGMNNVLDSRGYTQAALWNRIPPAAWVLMATIALCGNVLLGYGSRESRWWRKLGLVLPVCASVSFLLIADIDAPHHGLIRVMPQNLDSLARSIR